MSTEDTNRLPDTDAIIFIPGYTGGKPRGYSLYKYLQPWFKNSGWTVENVSPVAGCATITATKATTTIDILEVP